MLLWRRAGKKKWNNQKHGGWIQHTQCIMLYFLRPQYYKDVASQPWTWHAWWNASFMHEKYVSFFTAVSGKQPSEKKKRLLQQWEVIGWTINLHQPKPSSFTKASSWCTFQLNSCQSQTWKKKPFLLFLMKHETVLIKLPSLSYQCCCRCSCVLGSSQWNPTCSWYLRLLGKK